MKKKINYLFITCLLILAFFIILFYVKIKNKNKIKVEMNQIPKSLLVFNTSIEFESIENIVVEETVAKIEIEEKNEKNFLENKKEEVKEENQYVSNIQSSCDENQLENGHLKNYPLWGENYATLKISKIGVNVPIIFGATTETILRGVGHDTGSYLPGENGTIIMCGHNYMNNFNRFGELSNGDIIEVKTSYGDFYYKLYDKKIVLETEDDKLPIQEAEELIMIYTCYPFNSVGHTEYRYVIYGKKI